MESFGIPLFEVLERGEDGLVTKFGQALHEKDDESIKHSKQYRTTATDGEGCMAGSGVEKSLRARLVGPHGLHDRTHEHTWDVAHRFDLVIADVETKDIPYIKDVLHPTIKAIYAHISESPHNWRRVEALIELWGAT